jgi:hypothetical protein
MKPQPTEIDYWSFAPEIFKAPVPDYLTHYTSNAGGVGILQGGALWLSDISSLNDRSESVMVFDFLSRVIGHPNSNSPHYHILSSRIGQRERHFESFQKTPDLVCSLSEEQDSLDQWRMYGDDGKGVSVKFSNKFLSVCAASTGSMLGKCIYDESIKEKICRRFFDHLLSIGFNRDRILEAAILFGETEFLFHTPGLTQEQAHEVNNAEQYIWAFARKVGTFFKHPSFQSESEWRLVREKGWMSGKFRPSADSIVTYDEISLRHSFSIYLKTHSEIDPQSADWQRFPPIKASIGPRSKLHCTLTALSGLIHCLTGERYPQVQISNHPYHSRSN